MQAVRPVVILLFTASLLLALSACGRKGDLYLPDTNSAQGVKNSQNQKQ